MAFPVLIDERTLKDRIHELAAELRRDPGPEPYFVAVLDGARPFVEALCRGLARPEGDYDTIQPSSYGDETVSSGTVSLVRDVGGDVVGKRVMIVEDIVDTGRTLRFLRRHLAALGAASVEVLTLLSKPSRRVYDVPLRGVGFEIPDEFVVGFGMDLAGRYRDLPYIGVYSREAAAADA